MTSLFDTFPPSCADLKNGLRSKFPGIASIQVRDNLDRMDDRLLLVTATARDTSAQVTAYAIHRATTEVLERWRMHHLRTIVTTVNLETQAIETHP